MSCFLLSHSMQMRSRVRSIPPADIAWSTINSRKRVSFICVVLQLVNEHLRFDLLSISVIMISRLTLNLHESEIQRRHASANTTLSLSSFPVSSERLTTRFDLPTDEESLDDGGNDAFWEVG